MGRSCMQITVKTIGGLMIQLDVESSDTIASVKEKLLDSASGSARCIIVQCIIFERQELEDVRTLSDCNIGPESALYMKLDSHAMAKAADAAAAAASAAAPLHSLKQIIVQDPVQGDKTWTLAVEEETTVKEVNEMMFRKSGDPCILDGRVRLVYCGTALVDPEKTLCEYGIRVNSSKLFVAFR